MQEQEELYAYVNRSTQDSIVVSKRRHNGSTVTAYVSLSHIYDALKKDLR